MNLREALTPVTSPEVTTPRFWWVHTAAQLAVIAAFIVGAIIL